MQITNIRVDSLNDGATKANLKVLVRFEAAASAIITGLVDFEKHNCFSGHVEADRERLSCKKYFDKTTGKDNLNNLPKATRIRSPRYQPTPMMARTSFKMGTRPL